MRVKGQQGGGENYRWRKKKFEKYKTMRVRRRGRRTIHPTRVESVGVEEKEITGPCAKVRAYSIASKMAPKKKRGGKK